MREDLAAPTAIGPHPYIGWRRTSLGAITERIEERLILDLCGHVDGCRVLDIGCGDGALVCALAVRGAAPTGIDPDQTMLTAARARASATSVAASLVQGRVEQLPFADGAFDVVAAVTVLCFVPDAAAALREIGRVLRPGGRFVVGELGRWSCWAARRRLRGWLGSPLWQAARFRSAAGLRDLVEEGGLTIGASRSAVYFPPIGLCARLMAPVDPYLARVTSFGAAFIALSATRPRRAPGERPRTGCAPAASA
jgi:SAM-dependent methyltransferase